MNKLNEKYWKNRSVLITGASGLLGSSVCEHLLSVGANIISLVRDERGGDWWFPYQSTTLVYGDICDLQLLKRTITKYDITNVFHLAAQPIVSIGHTDPFSTYETNVRGTWTLLEAVRETRSTSKIVFASTDKSYGRSESLPYTEDMPLNGAFSAYETSKAVAEKIADCYYLEHHLNIIKTRCANIYGPNDLNWSRIVPGTIRSIVNGQNPTIKTDGSLIRDYIFVDDAARATIMLAETYKFGEAFNVSSEVSFSVKEIVQKIIDLMNHDEIKHPFIENRPTSEIQEQRLDSSLLRKTIDWSPSLSFDEGLKQTVDWYRNYLGDLT